MKISANKHLRRDKRARLHTCMWTTPRLDLTPQESGLRLCHLHEGKRRVELQIP